MIPITLYLADDHQIVVDGVKLLVSSEESMKIIGSSTNGQIAYNELLLMKPDIALIDLRMPGLDGLEIVCKLSRVIRTKFIILSMHNNKRYQIDAQAGGAFGYLLKTFGKAELIDCISQVVNGGRYFPTLLEASDKSLFTPREFEILKLVIDEFTTVQIAEQLSLSPLTVETHRKNIGRKTSTNTVLGLIKFLQENKIEV